MQINPATEWPQRIAATSVEFHTWETQVQVSHVT